MFKTVRSTNTGNLIWVSSSSKHSPEQADDSTAAESSSSSRNSSLSGGTCFNPESDSDSSNDSPLLKTIQEPLATPRPILKKKSKSEPRYIRGGKSRWGCLPAPPDSSSTSTTTSSTIIPDIPLSTSFKRTRSVRVEDIDNDDDCTTTTTSRITKHVGFGTISIRSYQQTVGDNPAVSYGFPIQLDWEFVEEEHIEVDAYEYQKGPIRRRQSQLTMSYYKRKNVLMTEYGIDKEELAQARKDVDRIKFRRGVTCALLPIMKVEDVLESAGRKAKRVLGRKRKE
eukprot:CAMPEP_0116122810 /NCGR_PEP_ID=MMETSP0329-20121206/4412_1 /TAXON_ID=697910 /ORGANISM="Pseudo-nitzschia arenysensis, Strain B593" /LENGTH=282 /DNA_ID=CAMNT_0003616681 /DNA_START=315 /DNA_END=1163 /DNA_ORIENTATION=-